MKNTLGNLFRITLFGESHGTSMGVVIDGLPAGLKIDTEFISHQMSLRKAKGSISTQRHEADEVKIMSGVFEGYSTGAPCCILIDNMNQLSKDYTKMKNIARPSHADYAAHVKYNGYQDYRGGGHFSGRLTAPLVAAGAIALQLLKSKGINCGTHIAQLKTIKDDSFANDIEICKQQIDACNELDFALIDQNKKDEMLAMIEDARLQLDAVGGILETCVLGIPAGIGEPTFDSIESKIAHAIFSIGAVKGIEFGLGFEFSNKYASEVHDEFRVMNGKIVTQTNNNGGINGGISNGMPIQFKTVIKPTPSISQPQKSIDFKAMKDMDLIIEGRHDPAIIHRARVVVDSMVAITLVDCLLERYGIMWFQVNQK